MMAESRKETFPVIPANPYDSYEEWRAVDPLLFDAEYGTWVITNLPAVQALLRNPKVRAEREHLFVQTLTPEQRATIEPLVTLQRSMMLFSDPPRHTRLRGLVNRAFTPRAVEGIRDRIARRVSALLDAVAERGRMDIIADLAVPLPVIVIAELLGVPIEDRADLKRWSDDFALFIGGGMLDPETVLGINESMAEARSYFEAIVAARRTSPQDDLISRLIEASDRGDVLSDDELFATALLLLFAGHETTTNLIGNGALALLMHPEQRAVFIRRPEIAAKAIEELLRYDSPVQVTSRLVGEPFTYEGRQFETGQVIDLWLGAANRDPEVFTEPARLDLERDAQRHVAFGYGAHFCLGAPLARAEGEIALTQLFNRFPDLQIDPQVSVLLHHPSSVFRALQSLPVVFSPA